MSDTLPSPPSSLPVAKSVLSEIDAAVERLESKWGKDHLDSLEFAPETPGLYQTAARNARVVLGSAVFEGTLGWDHMIHEAALAALDAPSSDTRRLELIRLAALCVAAVEASDRDGVA